MKKAAISAVVALGIFCTGIFWTGTAAAAEFAGNVTLASDYRFRGISQGDRSPAIQGGFDIAAENGLYFGTWASNVTFSGASIEMDFYAGWGGEINENTAIDVGVLWYTYPEDDANPDLDYVEFYASVDLFDLFVVFYYTILILVVSCLIVLIC